MTPVVLVLLALGAFYYYRKRKLSNSYQPGSKRHVMEPVSSSMLLSEVDPTKCAQVHIVTFIVFDVIIALTAFRDRFIENVIRTDPDSRFTYRLDFSNPSSPPSWVKATTWNPEDNISLIKDPQTFASIKSIISRRLTDSLDIRKPVWDMQFINEYMADGSSKAVSAVILTMHHSMGDGFTLCHQIMRRAAPVDSGITMHDCYPFHAPTGDNRRFSLRNLFRTFLRLIQSGWKLLTLSPDPPSALRNTTSRRVDDRIVSDMSIMSCSVDDLKTIAQKASLALRKDVCGKVSLNDLIVAACSLALGELMRGKRHDVTSAIWIGLNRKSVIERPKHRKFDWGNENLGTCYLQLPTRESEPIQCLIKSHRRLAEIKSSPEPYVANRLLALLGSIPLWILWPFRNVLMDKMSASISNFPGPVKQIKIPVAPDGSPNKTLEGVGVVKDAFFFVAPPFKYGPYVTILSYCGKMYLAMSAAEKLISQENLESLVRSKINEAVRLIDEGLNQMIPNQHTQM